jgi:hypothetical protein
MTDDLVKRLRDYCDEQDYYDADNIEYRKFIREAADALERLSQQQAEPTVTVSGPVGCGKSYVMETVYKALRDAGLHPYSYDLAHEKRMVNDQPLPSAKVWKLVEGNAPPAAQQAEPVAWMYEYAGRQITQDPDVALNAADVSKVVPLYAAPPAAQQAEPWSLPNSEGNYCAHHPDDPAHGAWCAAPPSDDEAVRLLHHVRMVLPDDRWADDTKRAIDAYLAKVNK